MCAVFAKQMEAMLVEAFAVTHRADGKRFVQIFAYTNNELS